MLKAEVTRAAPSHRMRDVTREIRRSRDIGAWSQRANEIAVMSKIPVRIIVTGTSLIRHLRQVLDVGMDKAGRA